MATPLCMKRMRREREELERSGNGEYCVHFDDDNLLSFVAYISGPEDSLYRHKFLKLKFEIPQSYPLIPPKVHFIQYTGGRIHPNLYVEGKVCLSILGTWAGEPWATAMNVESVLITIRSLLDNAPYKHEPGQRDNPAFNQYVQYTTWQSLLFDHLEREQRPSLKAFMQQYISQHGSKMIQDLEFQQRQNANVGTFTTPYRRDQPKADYGTLISKLKTHVAACRDLPKPLEAIAKPTTNLTTPVIAPPETKLSSMTSPKRKAISQAEGGEGCPIDLEKSPKKRKRAWLDVVDLT